MHTSALSAAARTERFSYAIRNIVAEAQQVELAGRKVRYLNIGDPVAFGFQPPPHLIDAVERAMRAGMNGYVPSQGILEGRVAVSDDYRARGGRTSPERVLLTTGTSEAIDLVLSAAVDEDDEVLVPLPSYPLYTAVIAKLGGRPLCYRTDPEDNWFPDLDHLRSLVTPRTRVLVVINPNNPTGAVYPERTGRALLDLAEQHGLLVLADDVYADTAYEGTVPLLGALDPDAPVISMSSLSKAYLAPGWRTGWLVVGGTPRLDPLLTALRKMADGRLCSPGPMQYAVREALEGDRSHLVAFRTALAERARITTERLSAIPGVRCVMPRAAFYAMPSVSLPPGRRDEEFVLALLRETGILVVHGSGFGMPAHAGFFRVVFLADPATLSSVYDDFASFTTAYLQRS
ncbi:MAG: aminotransferase class I/II-fold pyridoxal phosphate-dependent enzyme [Acidimicrobiia bacterium]|nr:aminotransferase class I/II-fold pyridoxal phosphate-dependent enzyme [Acidimicrobiia bacterium]